jgi:hypothetical protein
VKIFRDLISAIRFWFLKRAEKGISREKRLLGYSQIESVGIIYDASLEENYRQITLLVKDLQQDQKKIKTLGFVTQKKMPDYCFPKLTFEFCNKKSFGWNQKPLFQNVKDFIGFKYDVLIDLTPSSFHHVKYLVAISESRMRSGIFADKYVKLYDLMLQVDENNTLKQNIEHVFYYLKMINNDQKNK